MIKMSNSNHKFNFISKINKIYLFSIKIAHKNKSNYNKMKFLQVVCKSITKKLKQKRKNFIINFMIISF